VTTPWTAQAWVNVEEFIAFTEREAAVSIDNVCSWLNSSSWHSLTSLDAPLTLVEVSGTYDCR